MKPHPTDHEFVPDADCVSDCGICGWEGDAGEEGKGEPLPAGQPSEWWCANCQGFRPAKYQHKDLVCGCGHIIATVNFTGEPLGKTLGGPAGREPREAVARELLAILQADRLYPAGAWEQYDETTRALLLQNADRLLAAAPKARSARESSSGPSPESSPAPAPQGVEARPMKDGEA